MRAKRILTALLMAAAFGWAFWVLSSLRQTGESLSGVATFEPTAAEGRAEDIGASGPTPIRDASDDARPPADEDDAAVSRAEPQDDATGVAPVPFRPISDIPNLAWVPVPLLSRCSFMEAGGVFPGSGATWPAYLGDILDSYVAMSDEELKSLADSGRDGAAQFVYAYDRLLELTDERVGELEASPGKVAARLESTDDDDFETAKEYFVEAIRNHNWIAANRLAAMYDPFDPIEARAWLLIERRAGGRTLTRRESRSDYGDLTESERRESALRAEELIEELDLSSGLSWPDECRDLPQFRDMAAPGR